MSFHNVQFPTSIDYQSETGPGIGSFIAEMDSKQSRISSIAPYPKRKYSLVSEGRSWDELYTLIKFILCRRGALFSFRLKDWRDYTTAENHTGTPAFDDQIIGTGNGSTKIFQMKKTYAYGSYTHARNILLPVEGTVKVGVNGVEQTSGWTVNTVAGKIVFTTAPSSGNITIGCEFDVPVRFEMDAGLQFGFTFQEYEFVNFDSLKMVEVFDNTMMPGSFNAMGGYDYGTASTAHQYIWDEVPQVVAIESANGTYGYKMPSGATAGEYVDGLWWFLTNNGSTYNVPIYDNAESYLAYNIPPGSGSEIYAVNGTLYIGGDWNPS